MSMAARLPPTCFRAPWPATPKAAASHGALPLATCRQGEAKMNFDLSNDLQQRRDRVRRIMTERCTPAVVRRSLDGEEPLAADRWRRIAVMFQSALLSSPGSHIGGRPDESLPNIIAERLLGRPPDIRMDKGKPIVPGAHGPAMTRSHHRDRILSAGQPCHLRLGRTGHDRIRYPRRAASRRGRGHCQIGERAPSRWPPVGPSRLCPPGCRAGCRRRGRGYRCSTAPA